LNINLKIFSGFVNRYLNPHHCGHPKKRYLLWRGQKIFFSGSRI